MRSGLEWLLAGAWAALAYAIGRAYAGKTNERYARLGGIAAGALAAALLFVHHRGAPVAVAVSAAGLAAVTPHDVACRPSASRPAAAARGSLDTFLNDDVAAADIADGGPVRRTDVLEVRGWAASGDARGPVDAVCAAIDGRVVAQHARYGLARPDVASATGNAALSGSGYDDRLSARDLASGLHVISVFALQRGVLQSVSGSRRFVVAR